MKLTNAQIRVVNNAYLHLSNIELPCFISICSNIIELEAPVKKVEGFMMKVAEKNGWVRADKMGFDIPTDKINEWNSQTDEYMKKTADINLEKIKRTELEGPGIKIPGTLILELLKLKLIV